MAMFTASTPAAGRRAAWVVLLAAAAALFSFALACATPFPALAALAALHLRRRDAVALVAVAWLANQVIGYGFLDYPRTWDSFAWGAVIGVAAIAALAAGAGAQRLLSAGWAGTVAAFLLAFAAYEAVLFAATAFLPAEEVAFAASTVLSLFKLNALAFAGLWLLQRAGERFGLALPRSAPAVLPHHA
jgi:hypothetical protein